MNSSLNIQLWAAFFSFFVAAVLGNICRESCEVEFVTLGCFRDRGGPNGRYRSLPHYIYNERDPYISNYGGRRIEWYNWNVYYPGFACRCARKAKELGYDLFGLQFYGECWAGHSSQHNFAHYGYDTRGCVQDDYLACQKTTRYCMGKRWRNMVYHIVDTTCPGITIDKVDCFRDNHIASARPLADYIFNDRDRSIDNFSGRRVDWVNWDVYVPDFACRCALAAKALNHTFFGMQFYGECWSGTSSHLTYDRDGLSKNCVDQCYQPCTKQSKFCSGRNFANYVYRINDGSCEVDVTPVGCYKEDANDLAMQEIFYNEEAPDKPEYAGKMLPESIADYQAAFPNFLCRCAREAKENGWEYFGVREQGLCVRSSPTITNYDKYGPSSQCFEGISANACANGSQTCVGNQTEANYVYKVTLSGAGVPSSDVSQDAPDDFAFRRFSPKIVRHP